MGESKRQLDLVGRDVGVAPALERAGNGGRSYRAQGSASEADGAHDEIVRREGMTMAVVDCRAPVEDVGLPAEVPESWQ